MILHSQTIAENVGLITLERCKVELHVNTTVIGLVDQHASSQGLRAALTHLSSYVIESDACRHHAVDQQHIGAAWVEFAREQYFGLATVPMAGHFHEGATQGHIKRPNQVGEKHKGVVQYADHRQFTGGSAGTNLLRQRDDAFLYLLFGLYHAYLLLHIAPQ